MKQFDDVFAVVRERIQGWNVTHLSVTREFIPELIDAGTSENPNRKLPGGPGEYVETIKVRYDA